MEAELTWAYLVAVFTEWGSGLVVVLFSSQWNVTGSALEAAIMISPVQGLYRWFRKSHGLPTEATHLWIVRKHQTSEQVITIVKAGQFKA